MKGRKKLNCNGYRIQATLMYIMGKGAMWKQQTLLEQKGGNILNETFITHEHAARAVNLQTCIQAHLKLKTLSKGYKG